MADETVVVHSNIKETCLINITLSAGIFNKMHVVFVKATQSIRLNNVFC